MANPKWIKWMVGLSGAALFTGFIGLNADKNVPAKQVSIASSSASESSAIEEEWRNQEPNFEGSQEMDNRHFKRDRASFQTDNGSSSTPSSRAPGKMRTSAS